VRRIEWRFTEESLLSIGHWYEAFGDPSNEALLTLTQVIRLTDNPVWCLTEHARVLRQIVTAANDLLGSLDEAMPTNPDGSGTVAPDTPMGLSIRRAYQAVQHATMLLVDGLVECRKGRMETALRTDPRLCAEVVYALADAVNTQAWLMSRLRYPFDEG